MIEKIDISFIAQQYYQHQGEPLPEDISFGLICLDPDKGLGLINELLHCYRFSYEQGQLSAQSCQRYKEVLAVHGSDNNMLAQARVSIERERVLLEKSRIDWNNQNYEYLVKSDSWDQLKDLAKRHAQGKQEAQELWIRPDECDVFMHQLEMEWNAHAKFSRHTSAVLLTLYDEIIPLLEKRLNAALWELRLFWWFVPSDIRSQVNRLFEILLKELSLAKKEILCSMRVRLDVAELTGDPKCDDVIKYWRDVVFSILPDPQEEKNKFVHPRRELTDELYIKFWQRVIESGEEWEMSYAPKCINLGEKKYYSWLMPGEKNLDITHMQRSGKKIIFPSTYSDVIPFWSGWKFITPGRYYCYHFFEDRRSVLVATLESIPIIQEKDVRIKGFLKLPVRYRLRDQEQFIFKDLICIREDRQRREFKYFWQKNVLQLMDEWEVFLIDQARRIVSKKIWLLSLLAKKINELGSGSKIAKYEQDAIFSFIDEVRDDIHRYGCEEFNYQQFSFSVDQIFSAIRPIKGVNNLAVAVDVNDNPKMAVQRYLEQFSNGHLLNDGEFSQLCDYMSINVAQINEGSFGVLLDKARANSEKMLKNELVKIPASLSNDAFSVHVQSVKLYLAFLEKMHGFTRENKNSSAFKEFFYIYSGNVARMICENQASLCDRLERALLVMHLSGDEWLMKQALVIRRSLNQKVMCKINANVLRVGVEAYLDCLKEPADTSVVYRGLLS